MTSLEAQSTTAALERRAAARLGAPLPPPTTTEPLPCPRCQSPDTKFCYYNNYNFSQPRYFCKSCRRYWTRGGALRDVPVGGGSRKSAKRSRTASPASSTSSATSTVPLVPVDSMPIYSGEIGGESCGKFTTLLALGGYGLGLGLGLDLEEDRCSRYVGSSAQWIMRDSGYPYPMNVNGSYVGGIAGEGVCGEGGIPTWHMEGVGGGEYYSSMPELAISTPTNDDVK
ncbi:uncharacterized protein LOC141640258 [Silene latifolia]|uniref:uncharacterized protein LOC141640258 n=1 Tax=Silene latifolia TaxID=37657 RepID=UPI003D77CDE6